MIVNVRDLCAKNGRIDWSGRIEMPFLTSGRRDIVHAEPLQAAIHAAAAAELVEVAGMLTLPVEMVCSRCLTSYCQTLKLPFREWFTQDAEQVDEEDEHMHLAVEDKIDLMPFFEETAQLGLPYVPLCEEDCKGLDPETGLNLNIHPAKPAEARIDPRLEVLAQYFEKQKKQE
ncbi:YceD family protein [Paenibacillus koleovorans]|uniref:YceD family protein n=1 Tax=Paenibacillus koleovorans TaxID=121608 RepID=UPI000FD92ADC|nr:DUF177 domain-containing protein [Paenibacillus koleovorans]